MDSKKVGKFIATQRKQLSMTQQELADKLDLTNKAVSKWETGEGYPDISILPVLAELLEVCVDEILRGEKNSPPGDVTNSNNIKTDNIKQINEILDKNIYKFDKNYTISIGILFVGIIATILGLRFLQYRSISYSLIISIAFLIFDTMFYMNIYKGFRNDIQKYNNKVTEKKIYFHEIIYKRHLLFYAIYLIQLVLSICFIPLYPFISRGYSFGIFYFEDDFLKALSLIVYSILLFTGILLIRMKTNKGKFTSNFNKS